MSFHRFIVFYSVITAAFGIGFIVMPGQVFSVYGISADTALKLTGQLFGAALISLGLLAWVIRNMSDSETRKAIVSALLIGEATAFLLALNGQVNAVLNVLGWSAVVVYAVLSVGLAYFRFSNA